MNRPAEQSPNLRVLVVEDEFLIRLSMVDSLEDQAHIVFEAGNAADALRILAEEAVDVMVADIGLPDMSGAMLARQAHAQFPNLRIIFATGRDDPSLIARDSGIANPVMLRKPYTLEALRNALRPDPSEKI